MLYNLRHNGLLTDKLRQVLRGDRRELIRRARFLSRKAFQRLIRSDILEKVQTKTDQETQSETDKNFRVIYRDLREEASQVYKGPNGALQSQTILFRATKDAGGNTIRIDPDLGWARRLGDNFSTVPTPGNHQSLMTDHYANWVAAEIDRRIGHHSVGLKPRNTASPDPKPSASASASLL